MSDLYAVMGNPIAHSKSPLIHRMFAAQTGQDLRYEARRVEIGQFPTALAAFHAEGGKGLNITVPFKEEAWRLADQRSARAQRAGAINTLVWRANGSLYGDTTDGIGLVRDLTQNLGWSLRDKRILLLGAGGAVRGVLDPLLEQQPQQLLVANRTPSKALRLAADYASAGNIAGAGLVDLEGHSFDLIINGTAAGLDNKVPAIPEHLVHADSLCYDMMYGREPTAFVRWCEQLGAKQASDGLGMLVEQAAESFYLWRSQRPENTTDIIDTLRGVD